MARNYNLDQIKEIAGGDESFVPIIIAAFLEEVPEAIQQMEEGLKANNYEQVYQNAHKLKPTFKQFGLAMYDELIVLQDWGKFKQNTNVTETFKKLQNSIANVIIEMKSDFDL